MKLQIHLYNSKDVLISDLLKSNFLTELEKNSFEKYKIEETKKEKIVSSIFKNKYIGEYYLNEFGKPLSINKYFNISHSHGYVAFVIDNCPIGIDIEVISRVDPQLIEYISSEEEKKYIHDEKSFYEIWTNKEALVKASGVGIRKKPKEIVSLPINGERIFEDKKYFNKTIKYDELIITVSRQKIEDFDLEIIEEVI